MVKRNNIVILYFLILLVFGIPSFSSSQEIDQAAWQKLHDELAVSIIKLLSRSDSLDVQIDSLKKIYEYKQSNLERCQEFILALVGKDSSSIADFRRKFDETESKIKYKTGSAADARTTYFDEITGDKAICLPEFFDRYLAMEKMLNDWEGKSIFAGINVNPEGEIYTVVKGDCLYSISRMKYGSQFFWSLIREANKNGVANRYKFRDVRLDAVTDPDHIYPGQQLYLPPITPAEQREIENKLRSTWKERKDNPQ